MIDALFPVSSRVMVLGTSNDEINGKICIVERFDPLKRRFVVKMLESKRMFALKAKFLEHAVEDDDSYDDLPYLVPGDEVSNIDMTPESSAAATTTSEHVDEGDDPDFDDLPALVAADEVGTPAVRNTAAHLDDLPELEPTSNTFAPPPLQHQPAAPSSNSPPTTVTKRCNICAKGVQKNLVLLPTCSHVFCSTCPSHMHERRCCIVCQKCDPTLASIKQLPFINDLRNPDPAILELVLKEYICLRNIEVMEAIESKHQNEVTKLKNNLGLAIKNTKDTLRKVRDMVTQSNGSTRGSQVDKEAKAKVDEAEKEAEEKLQKLSNKHIASWNSRGIHSSGSALMNDKEDLEGKVTKAIEKHCRQATRQVHPWRRIQRKI